MLDQGAARLPRGGRFSIKLERQSARPKRSKQKAKSGRPARTAQVTVHDRRVEFRPPAPHKKQGPLSVWAVYVHESDPPQGVEPIEWCLLSTSPIASLQEAQTCLRWYCLRWRIEDWHRVLKSGCRVEALRHETAERLKRAIAIRLAIAWRLMLMTLLGRECPDLSASVLFSDLEIEVLQAFAQKNFPPPAQLGDAVRLVARIGGDLDRRGDPPPGQQLMWRGLTQLRLLCEGFSLRENWSSAIYGAYADLAGTCPRWGTSRPNLVDRIGQRSAREARIEIRLQDRDGRPPDLTSVFPGVTARFPNTPLR
ncbi:MAG: IS4 family transposase [Thiohalocapsa sp.]